MTVQGIQVTNQYFSFYEVDIIGLFDSSISAPIEAFDSCMTDLRIFYNIGNILLWTL